jgi:hypothetical protein
MAFTGLNTGASNLDVNNLSTFPAVVHVQFLIYYAQIQFLPSTKLRYIAKSVMTYC